jgi:hypothetical protein
VVACTIEGQSWICKEIRGTQKEKGEKNSLTSR